MLYTGLITSGLRVLKDYCEYILLVSSFTFISVRQMDWLRFEGISFYQIPVSDNYVKT